MNSNGRIKIKKNTRDWEQINNLRNNIRLLINLIKKKILLEIFLVKEY